MYLVRFITVDDVNEEYFYNFLADALEHFKLFVYDEDPEYAEMYRRIEVVYLADEDETIVDFMNL